MNRLTEIVKHVIVGTPSMGEGRISIRACEYLKFG